MQITKKLPTLLILFGLTAGLFGEGLLILRTHCRAMESSLLGDFRALVFVERGLSENRVSVVEEKLLALAATAGVRFVSPDESLAEIETEAPDVAESVALLGENPLPGAFEVRFLPSRLSDFEDWVDSASAIAEVSDVRFRALQVSAIRQIQFYVHYLNLLLASGAFVWAFAIALALASIAVLDADPGRVFAEGARMRALSSGLGAVLGVALACALAWPARGANLLVAWPPVWQHGLLILFTAAAGMFFRAWALMLGGEGRTRQGRSQRLVAAVAALLLLVPGLSSAASVRQKKKELIKVKQRLQQQRSKLKDKKRMQDRLEGNLRTIRREERARRKEIDRLRKKREVALGEKDVLDRRISSLERAHVQGGESLGAELGGYARHRVERSERFGSDSLWEESFRRAAIRDKTIYLAQLGGARTGTLKLRNEVTLRDSRIQLETRKVQKVLDGKRREARRTADRVRASKKTLTAMRSSIRRLEENAKALSSLITRLTKQGTNITTKFPKTPPVSPHSLSWPVVGKLLSKYGKRRVKELDTWEIRTGIEIAARPGTRVRPVHAGKVIFAGPFRSYGKVIILDHGKGFFSVYGHVREILLRKGSRVKRNTDIATVGPSKKGGGSLYLELRQGTKALNPLAWLKRR
jgi:murein DD-endopeptidase MepM/ murein hydrolase activator NlpD